MLDFLHQKVFNFSGTVLGFGEHNEFTLTVLEENSPYAYLQSTKDENIGFLVTSPFSFYPEYQFELEEKDRLALQVTTSEEVAVLSIITIAQPFTKSTINLMAPLVVNMTNNMGRQIVMPPKYKYSTKEPLYKESQTESGV